MKVFISWSGTQSRCAALALRDWLPSVIQAIDPYVSSEDIDKGARWSSDISSELEASEFGILCVTAENLHAPWVSFEAGALSKSLEQARVTPFLFGIERAQVTGPLLQFQSTVNEREDVLKLVRSINKSAGDVGLDDSRLESIFEVWWPKLEEALSKCQGLAHVADEPTRDEDDLLAEILELVREQQRMLRNPESILPLEYLDYAIERVADREIPMGLIRELEDVAHWLRTLGGGSHGLPATREEADKRARDLLHAAEFLRRRATPRSARLRRSTRPDDSS